MPRISILLDMETYSRIMELAGKERRSLPMQAEVMLRRLVGTFPPPETADSTKPHS